MPDPIIKIFEAERKGNRLIVNTGALDRDKDRVFPNGGKLENFLKNPMLLWGHNYREPWAVIGKATDITHNIDRIEITPQLREPANDSDPQVIIRSLWESGLVRAASIGFMPLKYEENDQGGYDFTEWELLEVSLVPVPANQEALRLAVKGLGGDVDMPRLIEEVKAVIAETIIEEIDKAIGDAVTGIIVNKALEDEPEYLGDSADALIEKFDSLIKDLQEKIA